jgi:tRNA(Ile)-lysidine synthetase-like protein
VQTTRITPDLFERALPYGQRAVLAVSGGVDSMALLHLAASARSSVRTGGNRGAQRRLLVATFDHATGAHSVRAAAFVARHALALGLPVVAGRARPVDRSNEASWRAARWRFLSDVGRAFDGAIVTAHTRDDQVETVLMRALRDASARGLAGLYADSPIRRPLIDIGRDAVLAYASEHGIEWQDDPTNASLRHLRNRIRLELLPALRRVRPEIDAELLALARHAAEWRHALTCVVDENFVVRHSPNEEGALDVEGTTLGGLQLGELPSEALAALWPELASRADVTLDRRGVSRLAAFTSKGRVGSRIQLSGGWEVTRARERFELRRAVSRASRKANSREQRLAGRLIWERHWSFAPARRAAAHGAEGAWSATLPEDQPLFVRAWQPGDRMRLSSGGRARKVKHLLSDAGITGHKRTLWPVILSGEEIVWIPGVRLGERVEGQKVPFKATARSGRPARFYVCDYDDS